MSFSLGIGWPRMDLICVLFCFALTREQIFNLFHLALRMKIECSRLFLGLLHNTPLAHVISRVGAEPLLNMSVFFVGINSKLK